jgi:glucokinase
MSGVPKADWVVGVDIGGTNLNVGVVPLAGGLPITFRTEPTEPQRGAKFVVDRVVKLIKDAISDVMEEKGCGLEDFAGVGIGSPGPLDRKTGTVISTPNLGWRNFPLRDLIQNAVNLPQGVTRARWWV